MRAGRSAVSAGEAGRLHCANHLHPWEAASHPRGGPQHHSCGTERQQEGALSSGKMRRGRAVRHWQQALLNQLVGHVLAHRPPQEASGRLSQVCTRSAKSASGTLDATLCSARCKCMHTLNRLNADFVDAHYVQTMSRLGAGPHC